MKKNIKLIFSLLLIVGIIGASPILLNRYNVEKENNFYELAINSNSLSHIKDEKKVERLIRKVRENNEREI